MSSSGTARTRTGVIWAGIALAVLTPLAAAATSPLLAWRDSVYITGGFAGILSLGLLLIQPLLAAGLLPGLTLQTARRTHRWVGSTLVIAVLLHITALWITSPPDMIDALLLASPTPFSIWGVIAMWAIFAAAGLAAFRRQLRLRPATWRATHSLLAVTVVVTAVLHTVLIEGTMEPITKIALCILVTLAMAGALIRIRTRSRRSLRTHQSTET